MGGKGWQESCPADRLCLTQTQNPDDLIFSLPTPPGKRFQLWALGLFCTERHLARRLWSNSCYPFTQQQPNGAARGRLGGAVTRVGRSQDPGADRG